MLTAFDLHWLRYSAIVTDDHRYIGETGRKLNARLTEQKRATRNSDINNHIAEDGCSYKRIIESTGTLLTVLATVRTSQPLENRQTLTLNTTVTNNTRLETEKMTNHCLRPITVYELYTSLATNNITAELTNQFQEPETQDHRETSFLLLLWWSPLRFWKRRTICTWSHLITLDKVLNQSKPFTESLTGLFNKTSCEL